MEFQNYAAQETSGLIAKLLTNRSGSSLQQLQALRDALETAMRSVETSPQPDNDVHELVSRLTQAADAAVQRVKDEANASIDGLRRELDALRQQMEQARLELDAKQQELETSRQEKDSLAFTLSQAEADAALLRTELQNEHERVEAADRDLAATVEAHAEVEAALHQAEAECRHEVQARTAVEDKLREARASLEHALGETGDLRDRVQDLTAENTALKDDVAAARQATETAAKEHAQAKGAIEDELLEARGLLDLSLAESTQIRTEFETRAIEMAGVKGALAAAQDEQDRLSAAHASLAATHDQLGSTHRQVTADHEQLVAEHQRLSSTHEQLSSDHQRVLSERDQLSSDYQRASSERDQLSSDYERATSGHEQLSQDNQRLSSELEQLSSDHQRLSSELEQLSSDHQRLSSELDQLSSTHQVTDEARQAEVQARLDMERQLEDARGLLDLALAESAELKGQLDARASRIEMLEGDLASASDGQARGHAVAAELDTASARLQSLEEDKTLQETRIRDLEAKLDAAAAAEGQLREQLSGQEQDKGGSRGEAGALRGEMDRMISLLDASVRAVDDLSNSTTVSELFTTLVERLSIQFSRVALFRLKSTRLEGEEQFGFDNATDVSKLVLSLDADSIVTRVARTGSPERLAGRELGDRGGMPFDGTPATALALPIQLQGETLGVVYADYSPWNAAPDGEPGLGDDASLGFAKLLVAQTGVVLVRHTHELKMLTELRDYAAMLLQEAEHMYIADADAGKGEVELRKRLKDNLDCASQLYAHRAALEGTAAAGLLDEQIAAAIVASTPFARDLGAIVGQLSELDAQVTAEAS